MKNSRIVLFGLLFANSFIIPSDPSANPLARRLVKKKGTFDKCFDSGWGFGKCVATGTAIAGGVTAGALITGGAIFVAYGAATGALGAAAGAGAAIAGGGTGIIAGSAGAAAGGATLGSATAGGLGAAGTAAYIKTAANLLSNTFSPDEYEEAPPSPRPAPVVKKEEKKPETPRKPDESNNWERAAIFTAGAVTMKALDRALDTGVGLVVQDAYDGVTGKKAKRDKEREEDLAIQREALALQKRAIDDQNRMHEENKALHYQVAEQNQKLGAVGAQLRADMGNLSDKLDDVFMGVQQ